MNYDCQAVFILILFSSLITHFSVCIMVCIDLTKRHNVKHGIIHAVMDICFYYELIFLYDNHSSFITDQSTSFFDFKWYCSKYLHVFCMCILRYLLFIGKGKFKGCDILLKQYWEYFCLSDNLVHVWYLDLLISLGLIDIR